VFEQMLVDDGILLFKYWLTVDQAQQEERFAERLEDPLKRWKLSRSTSRRAEKYADYTARATRCSRPRTRSTRRGRWSTSTTSAAAG
jgi:polyphosphate kinase